jgi:hypothetical protein
MTMPDTAAPRKRASRFWLYAIYFVVLAGIGGWSLAWLEIGHQIAQRMDQASTDAKASGRTLAWNNRHIGGYPFRIEITLDQPMAGEPSGWAVSAPQIKAIANAYDLNHWVIVAGQGVVLSRPGAGASAITGDVLRASWVNEGDDAPRLVVEGLNLKATPQPGAKPFPFSNANRFVFYTRSLTSDQTEVRLYLSGGVAEPSSRLSLVTGPSPLTIMWQATLSKVSALHGPDAPTAFRAWSSAGGNLTTTLGGAAAGGRSLGIASSQLSTDADGRLTGQTSVQIKGGGDMVRAMGKGHVLDPTAAMLAGALVDATADAGGKTRVDLTFQSGQMKLGPIAVSPSPKLF